MYDPALFPNTVIFELVTALRSFVFESHFVKMDPALSHGDSLVLDKVSSNSSSSGSQKKNHQPFNVASTFNKVYDGKSYTFIIPCVAFPLCTVDY